MRCIKPHCGTRSLNINRHHKRHQFMFLSSFVRTRKRQAEYKAFVKRYYEFRKEDVADVCSWHHAEVHILYDRIIQQDIKRVGKPLRNYSWAQANALMDKLEACFEEWAKIESSGINPRELNSSKRRTKAGFQNAVKAMEKQINSNPN